MIKALKTLGEVGKLLRPIQKMISIILPDFAEKNLADTKVRGKIVDLVDAGLKTQSGASAIPAKLRKKAIRKILDLTLDDIVLPQHHS